MNEPVLQQNMQQNMQEKYCRLGLHLTKGVGAVSFWRLVDHFGSAKAALAASRQEIIETAGIPQKNTVNLPNAEAAEELGRAEMERAANFGSRVIFAGDDDYSALLYAISDPPPILFVRGRAELMQGPCISIVGSRAASSYGRRVSFRLGRELAGAGLVVVSGLALGIDGEAHAGALKTGATIGVLGCGLDMVYPQQNRKLFHHIAENGLLVTEYPLGTRPEGFRFPARNRIIAGLSRGVVVVEAAKKSGSLITAQIAIDQNREVFAVPGQIDSFKSEGCHWLIKQGGRLVQTAADILEEFPELDKAKTTVNKQLDNPAEISGDMKILLDNLEPYPMSREKLIAKTGLRAEKVSEWLLFLELEGHIELLPGDEVRKLV
ncbi:MAG: DNA-protecting protein DprA [Deltaproteobacteria bacterium]|nr:MAG: DNA-protecting protein DprA [Deltaproteobacteria bacterium]